MKIQIIGGKVNFKGKGKTLLGAVNKILKTKSFLTSPSNVLPQVNFPTNNMTSAIFHVFLTPTPSCQQIWPICDPPPPLKKMLTSF